LPWKFSSTENLDNPDLNGVKLVISDAHAGLKPAIGAVLQGAHHPDS